MRQPLYCVTLVCSRSLTSNTRRRLVAVYSILISQHHSSLQPHIFDRCKDPTPGRGNSGDGQDRHINKIISPALYQDLSYPLVSLVILRSVRIVRLAADAMFAHQYWVWSKEGYVYIITVFLRKYFLTSQDGTHRPELSWVPFYHRAHCYLHPDN